MTWRDKLREGVVIPAHPLALTADRKLDERRQRALTRYYLEAGAGGIAVAVHTTQFEIRDHGLLKPVLELAAEELSIEPAIENLFTEPAIENLFIEPAIENLFTEPAIENL